MTPDALHALIEAGDRRALALLGEAPLGTDARNRTAFDVALACGNDEAVAVLAARRDAHALAALPRAELRAPLKHMAAGLDPARNLARAEAGLRRDFGDDLALGRTPLLQACRHGHAGAIEALLAAGAKPAGKDALGLDAADLCLAGGGVALLDAFLQACRRHARKPSLGDGALAALLHHPEALERAVEVATLGAEARRRLLAYHCARLDEDAVRRLLAAGLDPGKAIHPHANPVYEACTSRLLWQEELPGWLPLAWPLARHAGPPGSAAFSADPDDPAPVAEQMQRWREALRGKQARIDALQPDAAALAEQNARRLRIVDLLLASGLDPALVRARAPGLFVRDLLALQQPDLLAGLLARGIDLTPGDHELDLIPDAQRALLRQLQAGAPPSPPAPRFLALQASDARWELPGETVLLATTLPSPPRPGAPFVARVTVHDSYGPLEGCQVCLRDPDADAGDWRPLTLREELVDIDGQPRPRAPGEPAPAGEAPWSATFECELQPARPPTRLEIRVRAPAAGIDLVLPDWALA